MDNLARPQDLLLAYDADFTGYTSLAGMAQPLEPEVARARSHLTGTLGGTADPDGYYEDFTARLDRFVKSYPMLGGTGCQSKKTGGAVKTKTLDWKAVVVSFNGHDDSDSSGSSSADSDADDSSSSSSSGDSDGDDSADSDASGASGVNGDAGDADDSAVGGTGAVISLGDFIVDADATGGERMRAQDLADSEYVGGEMDETSAETDSYEFFHAKSFVGGARASNSPGQKSIVAEPEDNAYRHEDAAYEDAAYEDAAYAYAESWRASEPRSILGFVAKK